MTKAFKKIINPGTGADGNVFCHIQYQEKNNHMVLYISGVVGPYRNGNYKGSCGQIQDHLHEDVKTFSDGWTPELLTKLVEVWERWHLNDMRGGCEHQRAEDWNKRLIDPTKPLNSYGLHFEGQRTASWNMWTWIGQHEHPSGLLAKPCSVCGYKYGTAWKFEEVPEEVLDFLRSLPDTTITPAWI